MLSPLPTPTVVKGAETSSPCQIPPDELQRSWFGVISAMSKSVVLTNQLSPVQWVNRFSSQAAIKRVPAYLEEVPILMRKVKQTPGSLRHLPNVSSRCIATSPEALGQWHWSHWLQKTSDPQL